MALEEKLHIMQEQFDNATIQFSALKEKWYDEKLELEKQLLQKQQKFESTFTKANAEKVMTKNISIKHSFLLMKIKQIIFSHIQPDYACCIAFEMLYVNIL